MGFGDHEIREGGASAGRRWYKRSDEQASYRILLSSGDMTRIQRGLHKVEELLDGGGAT